MSTFNERWLEIQTKLQENAEPLGVTQSNIVRGDWQKGMPIAPPGIIIYLEPGDNLFASNPMPTVATVHVFCVVEPESELSDAVGAAMDLAWKAFKILRTMDIYARWPRNPVTIDTVQADIAVTVCSFIVDFDMPSLAPVTQGISTIPGMQLWLDAAAIEGVADGDGLRTWIDRSGSAHDALQLDAPTRPIYRLNRINGRPALHFDGNRKMVAPMLGLSTGITAVITTILEPTGGNIGLIYQKSTLEWRADDGGAMGVYTWANTAPRGFGGGNLRDGLWHIIAMQYSPIAASAVIRLDGAQAASDFGQSGAMLAGQDDLQIGRGWFDMYHGEIAEVAIYNRALSAPELGQVEAYMAGKYQIALTP
jgi:hypothetical protein